MEKQLFAASMMLTVVILLLCSKPVAANEIPLSSVEENRTEDVVGKAGADFGIWSYVTLNKHIVSGLSLSVTGEVWSSDMVRNLRQWWVYPTLTFRFNEYFSLCAGYRYFNTYKYDADRTIAMTPGHRWFAGGSIGVGFGPVRVVLREMIEQVYTCPEAAPVSVRSYLRSRIKANLKMYALPIRPYAEVENFLDIINDTGNKGKTAFMRYSVGITIPVAKIHSFDIYYRYQHHYNGTKPRDHVLGLGYSINL